MLTHILLNIQKEYWVGHQLHYTLFTDVKHFVEKA